MTFVPLDDLSDSLLSVEFDLRPLESKADQRIRVNLEPVQVIYDAVSSLCVVAMVSWR